MFFELVIRHQLASVVSQVLSVTVEDAVAFLPNSFFDAPTINPHHSNGATSPSSTLCLPSPDRERTLQFTDL